jgi:hypothetical protein
MRSVARKSQHVPGIEVMAFAGDDNLDPDRSSSC